MRGGSPSARTEKRARGPARPRNKERESSFLAGAGSLVPTRKGASVYLNDNSNSTSAQLPPLSNRGVTTVQGLLHQTVSVSIDWLRYSVAWPSVAVRDGRLVERDALTLGEIAARAALMPSEALKLTGEVLAPPKGYDTRLGLSYGSLRFHTGRVEQKIGVEFTGRDLDGLRAAGVDVIQLLAWVCSRPGSRVTRLDIAVDVFGEADPLDVYRAWLDGELVSASRQCNVVHSQRRVGSEIVSLGVTVYVGSRNSDRVLRVYDKALQRGESFPWTRIELESGGKRADLLAARLAGADDWREVARAAVRAFCAAPSVEWYTAAVSGPIVELPVVRRHASDRKRWLLEQCLPALRAELVVCEAMGDWELYDAFQTVLDRYLFRDGGVSVLVERQ